MPYDIMHYLETIDKYKQAGYKLGLMKDMPDALNDNEKHLFLRHDVDLSLESSFYMANYEYTAGIKSSYFVLLHSPLYNPLCPDSIRMLRSIASYGHQICYQVDARFSTSITAEMKVLGNAAATAITCYAPHFININPPLDHTMLDTKHGIINAMDYTHMRNAKDFHYYSDSNKHWREGCFCHHIDKYRNLQVLTHAEWWLNGDTDRMNLVDKAVELEISRLHKEGSQWKVVLQNYINTLKIPKPNEEKILES